MSFFTGKPGKISQQSLLAPNQQPLNNQLQQSAQNSFNQAGDYYRNLLSNDNETFNQFAQPELRRFREQTLPDIAEQFGGGGGGQGNFSGSGFRNASINAGTDLSERLGALRAQLRQQGAEGLFRLGQQGLQPTVENIQTERQPGFLEQVAPALGQAATAYFNPAGFGLDAISKLFNRGGEKSPSSVSGTGRPLNLPGYQPQTPNFGQRGF